MWEALERYLTNNKMINVKKISSTTLSLDFPFDWEIINAIKKLEIRSFDREKKVWFIPEWELKKLKVDLPNQEFELLSGVQEEIEKEYPVPEYLYEHQVESFKFLAKREFGADFSECGTGKTISMLAVIEAKLKAKEVKRVLIICPKSIMQSVWRLEIDKFLKEDFKYSVLSGTTKIKIEELKRLDSQIYIINFDVIRTLKEELLKSFKDQMIILDESTKIKNGTTQVSKACIILGNAAKFRFIMTGTPTPNSLLEIFPQISFLSPDIMGESFWRWRHQYFRSGGFQNYQWFSKSGTLETIKNRLKEHSVRWKKEQCTQLPDITYNDRFITLSSDLSQRYNEMKEELILNVGNGVVTAKNFLTKLIKLNEISNSMIMTDQGETIWFDKDLAKMKELDEILSEITSKNSKALIWSIYRSEITKLFERYKVQYNPAVLMGGLSSVDRVKNIKMFQEDKSCKILIAHPRTAAHGINLSVANYSIWISWDHSFESYEQANYRINRIGQKKKMTVFHIVAENTIDKDVISNVRRKKKINTSILKALQTKP